MWSDAAMARFGTNPTGKDFEKLADDGLRFEARLQVGMVDAEGIPGCYAPGTRLTRKDLGPGADLDYLMRQGAIVQVTDAGLVVPHAEDVLEQTPPHLRPTPVLPASLRPDPAKVIGRG
jgi:hypothetical protein